MTEVPEFNKDELLIILIALSNQQSGEPGLQDKINHLLQKVSAAVHDLLHEAG